MAVAHAGREAFLPEPNMQGPSLAPHSLPYRQISGKDLWYRKGYQRATAAGCEARVEPKTLCCRDRRLIRQHSDPESPAPAWPTRGPAPWMCLLATRLSTPQPAESRSSCSLMLTVMPVAPDNTPSALTPVQMHSSGQSATPSPHECLHVTARMML